jgi:hypothetical protein
MPGSSYPRICPVAMAASLLEPRWTMLLLCEMWSGSTRFNEIQRGVLGISPGLTVGIWGEGTWTNGEGGPVAESLVERGSLLRCCHKHDPPRLPAEGG